MDEKAVDLFVELATRSSTFAGVVQTRYAEWRNLFRVLKDLKNDETSALSSVARDASSPTDFEQWGRERSPMFADEFEKFLSDARCVEAVCEDLGASERVRGRATGETSTPVRETPEAVKDAEKSFRKMKTPSRAVEVEMGAEKMENFVAEKPRGGGLGAAARVETREPMRANVTPPPRAAQVVQKSPPPTPMPSQLSPPQSEYATPASGRKPKNGAASASEAAHVEHLMSYLTGFHGLLFGLKDHVERIRGATIENVSHELARTDARLDTAIARLEAAMGVESGENKTH